MLFSFCGSIFFCLLYSVFCLLPKREGHEIQPASDPNLRQFGGVFRAVGGCRSARVIESAEPVIDAAGFGGGHSGQPFDFLRPQRRLRSLKPPFPAPASIRQVLRLHLLRGYRGNVSRARRSVRSAKKRLKFWRSGFWIM